jgi:hypothetical protein
MLIIFFKYYFKIEIPTDLIARDKKFVPEVLLSVVISYRYSRSSS